jgi:hypothetical protein
VVIVPNNWAELQHYKDRSPPWIKLHKKLLDNYEFQCLPVASRALAPMLWLLASECVDGVIDANVDRLAFRLRTAAQEITDALNPLIQAGFFVVHQSDSAALAPRLHGAVPETEAETEALQRQRQIPAKSPAPTPRARKSQKTPLPDDFGINERVRSWAAAKGYGQIDDHLEAFKRKARAKAYSYADWDEAFMEAIREDWAKLRGRAANGAAPPPDARPPVEVWKPDAPMTPEQREASERARKMALASIGRVQ